MISKLFSFLQCQFILITLASKVVEHFVKINEYDPYNKKYTICIEKIRHKTRQQGTNGTLP